MMPPGGVPTYQRKMTLAGQAPEIMGQYDSAFFADWDFPDIIDQNLFDEDLSSSRRGDAGRKTQ